MKLINESDERLRSCACVINRTVMIEQGRNVFLYGRLPDWGYLGIAVLISLVVLQLGYFFFTRTKRGFADVL